METPWQLGTGKKVVYTIKNNTSKTYIIDPYGFIGYSYWTKNDKRIEPVDFLRGYYTREDADCKEDLLILYPHQKTTVYISLNYYETGKYDFSKQGTYKMTVKSGHNKQSATLLGCTEYIEKLENQGYKVLNDSIVAQVLYVK